MRAHVFARAIMVAFLCTTGWAASGQTPAPPKPVRVRPKLDGFDIGSKAGKSPNQVGGASRGLGDMTLYAPAVGKSYTLTPTFAWRAEDAQTEYTFRLEEIAAPQTVLLTTHVTGGSFTYPAEAPALQPGRMYRWTVEPGTDLLGGPATATLLVVGGPDREQVAAALAQARLAATPKEAEARVDADMRLWYDTIAQYTELIESQPARADLHLLRSDIYSQLPQTQPLAEADERAAAGLR